MVLHQRNVDIYTARRHVDKIEVARVICPLWVHAMATSGGSWQRAGIAQNVTVVLITTNNKARRENGIDSSK